MLCAVAVLGGGTASAASAAWCKGGITVSAARASVGKMVCVKGCVAGSYFAQSTGGSPIFVDLEFAYLSLRRLTLVIWQESRGNFPRAPEQMFHRGVMVCAQGYVSRYRGAAQIEVSVWDAAARLVSF